MPTPRDDDCAVPVVELSENAKGGYTLNVKELENILLRKDIAEKKVAVISVAGAFRKGKSFLLNFFVHYLEWLEKGEKGVWLHEKMVLDKFHWRGGAKRDTHGIILWSRPYVLKDRHNEEVVVLLMDTQGTFDHNSTVQECATIFAMSTLLSSVQIFNLSQQIQEDDLQNLRLFTDYAQLIRKDKKAAPFQKLMFLVRDWPYSDDHEYGYDGGADYIEDLLKTTKGQKKVLQSLRQNLGSSFEIIQGFLMPHPGLRIAKNNSEKLLGKVEEDFETHICDFVPSLFESSEIEPKKIAGCEITCKELFQLFQSYMGVFNGDALPEPKSILEATAEAANIAAEESAKASYDSAIDHLANSHPELDDQTVLDTMHTSAKKAALKDFDYKPKMGEADLAAKHRNNVTKHTEKRYNELKEHVAIRRKAKEEEKRLAEQKRKMEEQMRLEEQKAAAESERLKREREEQERRRRQMEEEERRREEEYRRREEQRKRDEAAARERQRQEEERNRREQERLAAERRRMQEEQRRQEEALAEQKRRIQRAEEEAAQTRRLLAQQRSYSTYSSRSYGCGSLSGFGGSTSSSGSSSSPAPNIYFNEKSNRWHDRDTGRFVKTPK